MAPAVSSRVNKVDQVDSENGDRSGSESEGGESSISGSRSSSVVSVSRKNATSDRSRSRSVSPLNSQASGSSAADGSGRRSRKDSATSVSPPRSDRSEDPSNSPGQRSTEDKKSVSRSPSLEKRKSRSPSIRRSDGASSRSVSPEDNKSNLSEKGRSRSSSHNDDHSNASRQSSRGSRSRSRESEKSESDSHQEISQSPTSANGNDGKDSVDQLEDSVNVENLTDTTLSPSQPKSESHKHYEREGQQENRSRKRRAILSDDSGSDVENEKQFTKNKNTENNTEKDVVIDAEALFGDASDISSDEGIRKKKIPKAAVQNEERLVSEESDVESQKAGSDNELNDMDDKEEEKENLPEELQPETRIDVEIPKIATDLGKDLHFVKLPNFLSVETRPFDPATYEDEIDEEETLDEEGRARLKLKVENTIRWKEVTKQNGEFDKQSNARFVRWSDGSMSLHLGSEIFDVYKQPLQGDHNHLFIRQGTGLQGQAVFRTKLTFRPHSTESFTHRKMTMSLADRSQKTAGIKVLSLVGKDPEAHRGELIKKEEERLRASVRRESRQRRVREKGAQRGLSTGYLEPDRYGDMESDDEGISINAIKKQHKNKIINSRDDRSHIYSSDEDGSDIETRRARRLDKAKALKDSDSEGSAGDGGGEDSKTGDRSSGEDD